MSACRGRADLRQIDRQLGVSGPRRKAAARIPAAAKFQSKRGSDVHLVRERPAADRNRVVERRGAEPGVQVCMHRIMGDRHRMRRMRRSVGQLAGDVVCRGRRGHVMRDLIQDRVVGNG